jgi:hypothetical protein
MIRIRDFSAPSTACSALIAGLMLVIGPTAQGADDVASHGQVVQVDLASVLNARPVTTSTGAAVVPWTLGVDGGGHGNGYCTHAAAIALGNVDPHALPDDALIPADVSHPPIQLHYANDEAVKPQAVVIRGAPLTIAVPAGRYCDCFLAVTSSEGSATVAITVSYAGTAADHQAGATGATAADAAAPASFTIPDYFWDIKPGDAVFGYVVKDLAKWNSTGKMAEKSHHNIDFLRLAVDPARTMTGLTIAKTKGGHLLLWAVTAEAAKP